METAKEILKQLVGQEVTASYPRFPFMEIQGTLKSISYEEANRIATEAYTFDDENSPLFQIVVPERKDLLFFFKESNVDEYNSCVDFEILMLDND